MVDTISANVMRAKSNTFLHNLEVMQLKIKKDMLGFLQGNEGSIFCLEARNIDLVEVLIAQILQTIQSDKNFDAIFTDFCTFTSMSKHENEDIANNFHNYLLVCKMDKEHLDEHFDLLKSWIDIIESKSKKKNFIVKNSKYLEEIMMKIGMEKIIKSKFSELWNTNEKQAKYEAHNCGLENNEASSNDKISVDIESTSVRALDDNVGGKSSRKTSLHDKAIENNADSMTLLESLGVEALDAIDRDDNTRLHCAARDGKTKIVESLLALGAKKEMKNNCGRTALHLAAMKGHVEIVKVLLEQKANVNAIDNDDWTPLHWACSKHYNVEIIQLLLKFGAGIERKDMLNNTPLHLASYWGQNEIVKSLLKHGANVNAQSMNRDTPLYLATTRNKQTVVLTLLDNGADLNIRNMDLRTALDVARIKRYTNLIHILEKHADTVE